MSGPPVTIVSSGGLPMTAVSGKGPQATVVKSGGLPITLTSRAAPVVLDWMAGYSVALDFTKGLYRKGGTVLSDISKLTGYSQSSSPNIVAGSGFVVAGGEN